MPKPSGEREIQLADADQRYNFICPNCSGSFSIQIDRIPPVQARFRCPHCKQPMDFPSRDEARQHIRLQSEGGASAAAGKAPASGGPGDTPPPAVAAAVPEGSASTTKGGRFRVDKPGFQADVFDRRGIRNLIRTHEILETDRVRVDDSGPVPAGDLPDLKSLFSLARNQKAQPPTCCRTHTDGVAFYRCHDSGRPLCEQCAPEKEFGGSTIRVCQHCGGTAEDFPMA
jgi:predicted Zn finger-like uncharacterized protein